MPGMCTVRLSAKSTHCPGASSLAAALHPAETNYLYFVARPDGDGHVFTSNLAAHNKAVGNYRHAQSHVHSKTAHKTR